MNTETRSCARHGQYGGPYCLVCGYTGDDQPSPSPSDEEAIKVVADALVDLDELSYYAQAIAAVAALRRAGWLSPQESSTAHRMLNDRAEDDERINNAVKGIKAAARAEVEIAQRQRDEARSLLTRLEEAAQPIGRFGVAVNPESITKLRAALAAVAQARKEQDW